MNILFYIDRYPGYGGIETVTTSLANYWATELNWDISILSIHQQDYDTLSKQLNKKVKFYKIPITSDYTSPRNVIFINDIIQRHSVQFIIFQDSYANIEILLQKITIKRRPFILIVEHNTPNCSLLQYKYYNKNLSCKSFLNIVRKTIYPYKYYKIKKRIRVRHKNLYTLCDQYILLSKTYLPILSDLIQNNNIDKAVYIPNPINNSPTVSYISKKKCIIFVGRFEAQKGIAELLHIWEEISHSNNDWKLKLIGDGTLRNYVVSYIKQNNLSNISIEGYQNDMQSYYNEASIIIMTSIYEGFPMVLLEAMSHKVIPIAYDSFSAIRDIIESQHNGILVKSFDRKMFITQLSMLMNGHYDMEKMANKSLETAISYNISKISKFWEELFYKYMHKKNA